MSLTVRESLRPFIWPEPQSTTYSGRPLSIPRPLAVWTRGQADWLTAEAGKLVELLNRAAGRSIARAGAAGKMGITLYDNAAAPAGVRPVRKAEGYALRVDGKGVVLAATDAAGAFRGAQTLAQLVRTDKGRVAIPAATVRDWPALPMRGAHIFVPPVEELEFFERFLDMLAEMKFNTLFIELAGAMEFKRHPEINRAWAAFSKAVTTYDWYKTPEKYPASRKSDEHYGRPGVRWPFIGPVAVQTSRYYWKDSTHPENGGGRWLTQQQMRKIVAQCRARHIEVIPEVQSLSHCYWLCCAHPEIAERADDPWPDTYCPCNERTYELLLDCMGEALEVFEPRIMHVGHDEVLSLRVCPRCKRRSGARLFADDVTRIRDWLAARGVRTMIWPDKLIKVGNFSGAGRRERDPGTGKWWILPPTHRAIDLIPRDVMLCDWYWGNAPWAQQEFARRGFEVCYGNFTPRAFKDWDTRSRAKEVLGAEISSWCKVAAEHFGHNRVFHDFFPGAQMLWRGRAVKPDVLGPLMARRFTPVIERTAGLDRAIVRADVRVEPVGMAGVAEPLPGGLAGRVRCAAALRTAVGSGPFELIRRKGAWDRAVIVDAGRPQSPPIPLGRKLARLVVVHATTMPDVPFPPTWHHYHLPPASLVEYEVKYADGRRRRFSATYGLDIGPLVGAWPTGGAGHCWRSVPVAAGRNHTLYAQEWVNPRPDVPVESLTVHLGPRAAKSGAILLAAAGTIGEMGN